MPSTLATAPETLPKPPPSEEIELSVVMPCLNEAKTVGRCVAKAMAAMERLGIAGEVVVADNGSTDGSQQIAYEARARIINAKQRGYGSALQAGIAAARGQFIIMGDADDSYDFTCLEPFVERLRAGDELVMGNRFRGGIKAGAMPWHHRYIGNPVLTSVLNLFFHSPIGDAHCGLRGFRKDAYQRLGVNSPGMEFASEMVVKSCLAKQKISEVPVFLYPDGRGRPPHLRSFRDGWRHLRLLLLLCPRWLYLLPALLLFCGGLGLMIWLTPGPRQLGSIVIDVHTMLCGSLMVLLGYQTMWLWAHAKIFGWTSGMLPAKSRSFRIIEHITLERGLIIGALLLLGGLGLNVWLVREWLAVDLGPLDVQQTLRTTLWGFTAMVLGLQTIYGSFFQSMLGMLQRPSDRTEAAR
jgi:glycosyltransferase involved in cell wall biosynthesis